MRSLHNWLYSPASTNLRVIAWALIMLVIAVSVVRAVRYLWSIHPGFKAMMEWIATAPTTNLRIINGIVLATLFVLGTMIAGLFGFVLDEQILLYIGGFILLQEGIDMLQFGWKRSTFKSEAMGLTREGQNPSPPSPATQIVQQTGEAPVAPKPEAPAPPNVVVNNAPAPAPLPQLPDGAIVVPGEGD